MGWGGGRACMPWRTSPKVRGQSSGVKFSPPALWLPKIELRPQGWQQAHLQAPEPPCHPCQLRFEVLAFIIFFKQSTLLVSPSQSLYFCGLL